MVNQHSPLDRLTHTQGEKRKKTNLNNKQVDEKKIKRHLAKRAGRPELQRVGEERSPLKL
jgi:hypothetical protein